MDELKRRRWVFRLLSPVVVPILWLWLGYRFDSLRNIPQPCLLLCNHTTDLDPVLLGAAAGGTPLCFVASEHILRKPRAAKLLDRLFKPILHEKGGLGLRTSMNMFKRMKNGEIVCLFPEGNRSFDGLTGEIPEVTGKLSRRSGVPLVTYRLEGGYFTQPRWGLNLRRGRVRGHLVHIYSSEELQSMTDEETTACIRKDLFEDATASQKANPARFYGSRPAEGLESTIFSCPSCGAFSTLQTTGSQVTCTACGYTAQYTAEGALKDPCGRMHSVAQWNHRQKFHLARVFHQNSEEALFSDPVTRVRICDHQPDKMLSCQLTAYRDHFTVDEKIIWPSDISGLAIYSRNTLLVHLHNLPDLYEIRGGKSFSALKYLYLHKLMKGFSPELL